MIKTAVELLEFLFSLTPFLVSLVIWTFLAIRFSKSIKQHAKVYYWVFGILGFAFAIPVLCRVSGFPIPFSINSVPVIGQICSELSSAAYFIHPVLVIIMAMGAFSPKTPYIGRLMTIRKELSIIVGFPLLAHLAKRLFGSFPKAWNYFANYEESITDPKVVSELGSNISNGVFVLGIVMTVVFIVLWVTSFDSVRRKMGQKRWKSVQKWSYALYAMLFIHSVGLQLGGAISYNAMQRQKQEIAVTSPERAEGRDNSKEHSHGQPQGGSQGHSHGQPQGESHGQSQGQPQGESHGQPQGQSQSQSHGQPQGQSHGQPQGQSHGQPQGHGHGPKGFSFSDIEVTRHGKAVVNIIIYILIYGSYLILRLRKAKQDRIKKASRTI